MLDFTGWWCQNKKTALPGSPCDRDAMSRINVEGKHVGDHSSFLYGGCGSAAVWHGVEISIESAAVQLHKIQDGCSQFLHNCHWKEKKKIGSVVYIQILMPRITNYHSLEYLILTVHYPLHEAFSFLMHFIFTECGMKQRYEFTLKLTEGH